MSTRARRISRRRGLSIVETLVSLALAGVLLAAITAALNASFYAYASAAESASTQASSRLVMQRMMTMIRTGALHDAYDPGDPAVTLRPPVDGPLFCVGIQLFDFNGNLIRVWWQANAAYADANLGDLWYTQGASMPAPLLERVTAQRTVIGDDPYIFVLTSRYSDGGLLLSRATVDLTVEPGADATLMLEDARGAAPPVRLVASTMPRKNLD